ncbi:phage tail spike protein [Staphylococcus borealis]|uniref:phage tail spike protein n=1 Tax=Staphylococcus borealis TaxID=2742203 RepID=UPI0025A249D5|nr:phage tail spike protein [Staphylococcus borealis]MDM7881621.1 phage tail spike protein [Staphylococcus borealis]
MKNVGIHVLDFNDNIIDFISQSDGALINAEISMNVEEKTETFDFTIENTRAEKLRERNRIIAQDNNGTFREFIIIHIADNFDGTTEIECNASYLEDLKTAKPIKPGKFEAHTTTQALLKTLADTGWEVSEDTEYGGNRTTSWTSHTNPFDLIYMLCTTYDMVPSFYIELGAHTVEHRYVSITKPKSLFKGKEITKGKDLTGMTRTIDLSEVKTALLAVGPEKEDGSRIETVVVDDEAQEIFGLPNRYIWDVYEPETEDENMTLKRLTTLAKTELNKRNQAAISYEVSSIDIHKYYEDINVHLRDIVRVKDRDFRPPLYIEAEVIGIKYNWLSDESEFTFGNVIEYEETKLREFFTRKLDEITKKLNDNISNVNTIVSDVVAGELEYYERKIFKGAEPPENPQNDTLWYDTSNPDVAVLRRYWNGEWITQTADDVEKIGGLRREQVMYRDLNNSFINLTIQHSKLQNDVYDVLNNEYLADDDLKANLNQALSDVDSVYQNIKTNLDSIDEETATIGKLVDTQTLFTVYREKLQTLYKYVTDAKISIDRRLKLLQSQYTDEKFNDAMDKIAQTLPNGRWDSENQQLYADIPNEQELSNLKQTLQDYYDGNIKELEGRLNNSVDSKVKVAKDEISANVKSVESRVNGVQTRVDTTESNISALKGQISLMAKSDDVAQKLSDVDGRLTPLETTVQSNKATLDVLPTQIDSKVSKQDYTLDKDNIVQRLNNADSDRIQLANKIEDRVTITEYNNGIDSIKSTNRNYLQSYYSSTQNSISGITKGPYNVTLNKNQRINFYFYDRSNGGNPSLKQDTDYILKIHESSSDIKIGVFYKKGSYTIVGYTTDKVIRFNTGNREDILIVAISQSNEQYIGKISLYEGTKELDWSPAPEDIELLGLTAETNAKAYTDAQKEDTDVKLTKMDTDISQNGKDIQLRATKEEFNATNKTLSKTVADFTTNVATGMTFTYNENGTIQAMNIGNDGIKLRGDKVDITVNKEFNVVANKVDNKVGKDEIINRLNLSPEGLNIDVNKVALRGGDSVDYIDIRNNSILSYGKFTRTWANETDTANLRLGIQGGTVKVQNRTTGYNLYLTEKGLSTMLAGAGDETAGTLEFHSKKYNDTSRGVRLHSTYGAVALESDYSRIILNANLTVNIESNYGIYFRPYRDNRTGNNEFAMYVKQNDSGAYTDGVLKYGNVSSATSEYGSGLRFSKSSVKSIVYATNKDGDIGTGDFYGDKLYGDLTAKSTNAYILADGALRVTDKNGYNGDNTNYRDIQCQHIASNTIRTRVGKDFYIGVSDNELRVTNNLFYNGGNTGYKPVRAKDFIKASSAEFKHNIKKWDYDALNVISNELQLYSYKYNDDEKETIHHGPVIGDGYDIPVEFIFESGVNTNEMLSWALRAIQQLNEKINTLEEQLNE